MISPWIFYLIAFFENLRGMCLVLMIASSIVYGLVYLYVHDLCIIDDVPEEKFKKWNKCALIVFITTSIGIVTVPSKDTCYKMLISSFVTTENVEIAKEQIRDIVDYIQEEIKEVKE